MGLNPLDNGDIGYSFHSATITQKAQPLSEYGIHLKLHRPGQHCYRLLLATLIVRDLFRKVASSIPAIVLILLASFYGIQDPTLTANTDVERTGWADRTSWNVGLILSQYINQEEGLIWMDLRLSTPLSSLRPDLLYSGGRPKDNDVIAIIGIDSVSKRATFKDPRNVDWFISKFGTHAIYLINHARQGFCDNIL